MIKKVLNITLTTILFFASFFFLQKENMFISLFTLIFAIYMLAKVTFAE